LFLVFWKFWMFGMTTIPLFVVLPFQPFPNREAKETETDREMSKKKFFLDPIPGSYFRSCHVRQR
jgi:hypothetical protein